MVAQRKRPNLLLATMALALVYAIVGKCAIALAIPPGYATAIFPSAGIALGAILVGGPRLLPGVLIGSAILNTWIAHQQGGVDATTLAIAIAIGCGAALQAFVGWMLIRRKIGYPNPLSHEKAIICFMGIAGPLGCLIGAGVGTATLFLFGILPIGDTMFFMFTWWVGDTIGALLFTPLMLVLFGRPYEIWQSRRKTVLAPLLCMTIAVIVVFVWSSRLEQERERYQYLEFAQKSASAIRASFDRYFDSIEHLERFFVAKQSISRTEFKHFVDFMVTNQPGLKAIGWNPVIAHHDRAAFEAELATEGFDFVTITERNNSGDMIPAQVRTEYVAVKYIEPLHNNQRAIGYDVASDTSRFQTLTAAKAKKALQITPRINLVQDDQSESGFLAFKPVFSLVSEDENHMEREKLRGYAVGVFNFKNIIDQELSKERAKSMVIGLYDETDPDNVQQLYGPAASDEFIDSLFVWRETLSVGGRSWALLFKPTERYLKETATWHAWIVSIGGFLFITIIIAFLLAMTGRSFEVSRLVKRRTEELSGILKTAIESIITINHDGIIQSANPATLALTGFSKQQLLGQPIEVVIPQLNKDTILRFADDRDEMQPKSILTDMLGKNGQKIPVQFSFSTLKYQDAITHTLLIHDLADLHKANRLKDEFVSVVSHELRTPLTSIKGAMTLLDKAEHTIEREEKQQLYRIALSNCDRLEALINDLLDIEKLSLNSMQFSLREINPVWLLKKSIDETQSYAAQYNITIKWIDNTNEPHLVNVDSRRIIQVMTNLLSNAVKHSPEGRDVEVTAITIPDAIRVEIRDYGDGIPENFHDQIFEKFAQVDSTSTRQKGGTGLGLAISQAIIHSHDGKIGFQSEAGKGAVFYFELPNCNDSDTESEPEVK